MLALIALASSISSALLLARAARQRTQTDADENRKDREQIWTREDALSLQASIRTAAAEAKAAADKAESDRADAAGQAAVAATLLLASNERSAAQAALNVALNKQVLTFVNGSLTASKEATLAATSVSLELMKGRPKAQQDASAIAVAEAKVEELRAELVTRYDSAKAAAPQGAAVAQHEAALEAMTIAPAAPAGDGVLRVGDTVKLEATTKE